jgi:hypothetical protein
MFTVVALVITMYLLYVVTSGIKASAATKRYRTVVDATYGGADIMAKDLIIAGFSFKTYSGSSFTNKMTSYMTNLNNGSVSSCFRTKLTTPRSQWGSCADVTESPKINADITFELGSAATPFIVYSKIVETMDRKFQVLNSDMSTSIITKAGNTDESGLSLDFGSTTEGGGVTVPHYPYIYRVEIQGERKQNPNEKSKLSVLYAY